MPRRGKEKKIMALRISEPRRQRKQRIEQLLQNKSKFEATYEARRLHIFTEYAKLTEDLRRFGVDVSHEPRVEEKVRKKTGHAHYEVSGMTAKTGVRWNEAQNRFREKFARLQSLLSDLHYFFSLAESRGIGLHKLPDELLINLEAVRLFVMSRGTNRPTLN